MHASGSMKGILGDVFFQTDLDFGGKNAYTSQSPTHSRPLWMYQDVWLVEHHDRIMPSLLSSLTTTGPEPRHQVGTLMSPRVLAAANSLGFMNTLQGGGGGRGSSLSTASSQSRVLK